MKLIKQICVCLVLMALSTSLEAKTLEFLLDHTTEKTVDLSAYFPDQMQKQAFDSSSVHSLDPQRLKVENVGNQPLKNCFPSVNQAPCTSLDCLAARLADEEYPLLALYQLWDRSIVRDETLGDVEEHPLDLLHFKGACSSETFHAQFLQLCNALGIETRLANVHGKRVYDFRLDEEWNFLDLAHQQLYLGLDNSRLVSSEEVMDDPFLALRTKHQRKAPYVDVKEAWKQLAHFEILEPASAMPVVCPTDHLVSHFQGVDLYPHETLVFETPAIRPELATHERYIEQTFDLEARQVPLVWKTPTSFPVQNLINRSSVSVRLIDQEAEVQPGETFTFKDQSIFTLNLEFEAPPKGQIVITGTCAFTLFPALSSGANHLNLGVKKNPTLVSFNYEVEETLAPPSLPALQVLNQEEAFHFCSPSFLVESSSSQVESIWWQIALDSHFQLIPSNFDQVESFTSVVTLPLISETFLNPEQTYYFRVKGYSKGQWSEWSTPYAFVVNKPLAVEDVVFDQVDENTYELNWERRAEESEEPIEYFVFGSNALDFIPSIYCDKQVNAIVDGEVTEEEINDNLVAITTEPKIRIQGSLAYYRIVARKNGQFSVPSTLVHVYDQDLIQPRNVLQVVENDQQHVFAKRTLFPASYPWIETSLPHVSTAFQANNPHSLIKLQVLLRAAEKLEKTRPSYQSPEVSEEIWEEVRPYLLPPNHPAWPKLNRIFCKSRATQTPEAFKKAGFRRWRPGRWSRVAASAHPECQEYFIKAYCDNELGILYDWRKWIHRIKGAETIRQCIKKYHLQSHFSVPNKWIYPLPKHPSPPKSSRYLRKNFILICENMRIQEHKTNEKMYKKNMTPKMMEGLYTILQVCGLYDSVYCFNMPFCKNGRIAIIDTEYHHKWPVPFHKLTHAFSKEMRVYWGKITARGGRIPDGITQPNPPRMDRRDIPQDNQRK